MSVGLKSEALTSTGIIQVDGSNRVTITLTDLTTPGGFSAATITETSSRDVKSNIKDLEDPTELIKLLRPVIYDRADGSNDGEIGLIAEEVAEVFPGLVKFDEEGNAKEIYYTKLSVVLLAVVQRMLENG